jgi:rhodanese-related sulfurtransferase
LEVIVYCAGSTCHASEKVGEELTEIGYSEVRRYAGGTSDWIEAGLLVTSQDKKEAA